MVCAKNKTVFSTLICCAASVLVLLNFCLRFVFISSINVPLNERTRDVIAMSKVARTNVRHFQNISSLWPFSNDIRRKYNTIKWIHWRRKGVGVGGHVCQNLWCFSICFSLVLIIRQCPFPSKSRLYTHEKVTVWKKVYGWVGYL